MNECGSTQGGEREKEQGGGTLFIRKTDLGIWSFLNCLPSVVLRNQETKLTLPCKSEISLFGFANSFLALLSFTREMSAPILLTVKRK